ncbi:MAG TPA: PIG-L family deacetylase [Chthonomonadales bacterium]|nr:PIG-L family deacetylase [Chthonomonadales bacterium]
MRLRLVSLALLLTLLAPFLYLGAEAADFVRRNRAGNSPSRAAPVLPLQAIRGDDRVLVVSPHPDDEVLACAGLIQHALEAGARVRVLVLTNGDGFRLATATAVRRAHVEACDHLRMGERRQSETLAGLQRLGLHSRHVEFLGYPDGGLEPLWRDHWSADNPYRSPWTGMTASALRTRSGSVPYAGEALLGDLRRAVRELQPTIVAVPHPLDDHPDHAAASAFATLAALQEMPDANRRLLFYVVHRGDWPTPMSLHREKSLPPPAAMRATDTRWHSLSLTPRQVERKLVAIAEHRSQTAVMERYLKSFARSTESFGEIPIPQAARLTDAPPSVAWPGTDRWAWMREPVNDNVARDLKRSADIQAVGAARDATTLFLQVVTVDPLPRNLHMRIHLRFFGDMGTGSAGGQYVVNVRTPSGVTPADLAIRAGSHSVQVAVPLRELGHARGIAAQVETVFAGVRVDSTGYRFVGL